MSALQLLSIISDILSIADKFAILNSVQKLRVGLDKKKLENAYRRAFTRFFDSYGPGSNDLVVDYNFFDKRVRVKDELARLVLNQQPLNMEVLLEEFEDAFPKGDTLLFIKNMRGFREEFDAALELDVSLDTKLIISNTSMIADEHELSLAHQMHREFVEIKQLIGDASSTKSTEDTIYDRQIDQARDLIKENKAGAALSLLRKLEENFQGREVSNHLRLRLVTNIGACFLHLGEDEKAIPYMECAQVYEPRNPQAIANAALAKLLKNEVKQAIDLIEQALEIEPKHSLSLSILIQILVKVNKLASLTPERRKFIEEDVESRRWLSIALIESQDYKQAEKFMRLSLEGENEKDIQDLALLAQTILEPIQINRTENPRLPWNIPPDETARLQEAENLLNQVVEAWGLIENRQRLHHILMLRATSLALHGKFELALQDYQRVLNENPNNSLALYYSGLSAFHLGDYGKATEFWEKYQSSSNRQETVDTLLAVAYLQDGRPHLASKVLLAEIGKSQEIEPSQKAAAQAERLYAIALIAQRLADKAEIIKVTAQLDTLPQDDPIVLEIRASVALLQGEIEKSVQYYNQALALAEGELKDFITFELAELYFNQHQFDKAVSLYEIVAPPNHDTPPTRKYIISLLNSGNWNKAYDLAREIRANGKAIPAISEVEALTAQYIGDLESALHLYQELAELEPNRFEHFDGVASTYVRLNKAHEAAIFLDTAVHRFSNNPQALINIAKVFAVANRPASDVLPLAYRAWKLGNRYQEVHLGYFGLLLKPENDPTVDLHPNVVAANCSIKLKGEQGERWIAILTEEPIDRSKSEFHISDPIAKKLLGHKTGAVIEWKSGHYEQLTYTIIEIQSVYIRAFQEIVENFSTWFPDNQNLYQTKIIDNDISPIFRMTEGRLKSQEQLQEMYAGKQLTLERFAEAIGRSIVEIWGGRLSDDVQIISSVGSSQEQQYHQRILETNSSVTVDLLTLFTLSSVNRLNLLAELFENIYIAQACVDVLIRDIQILHQTNQDYGVIGRDHERYTFIEIPKEVTEQKIQFLENVLNFAQEKCQVTPMTAALELESKQFAKFEIALGRSSIASILVAKATGGVLYSDDLLLRTLAKRGFSVDGVWTQPVLNNAHHRSLLKFEDYCNCIATLVRTNYSYVSLNHRILLHELKQNQWVVDSSVEKVFSPLIGPKTADQSAVTIVTNLIERVWSEEMLDFHKTQILDLCLRTLAENRNRDIILYRLQEALNKRFIFRDHLLAQVQRDIELWLVVHQVKLK